jgi:prepilin-type N-terminal cleavage/methylation domain-containing protein/prepilin-type processing-associated H-X9-DG protein
MERLLPPTLRRRDGFTLVELLVVLAVISILVALLIPAVQRVREAANSTQCRNNLKQIGIACHAHNTTLGYFPSGGWEWWLTPTYTNGVPQIGQYQTASWAFQILPYLEQDTVWRADPAMAIATPVRAYFCPSRRSIQTVTYADQYVPSLTGGNLTHALCDYAGSNYEGTGVIAQYYPTRLAQITDGTSTTLLVGEKRLNVTLLGQNQPDDNEGYTAGWDEDTMARTDKAPKIDIVGTARGNFGFGSSHPGGFNAVFADGSVHVIAYNVDPTLFANLGAMADGQYVDTNGY